MPLSAAALRKRENAKLAGARVHLYYQGSGAANVANDLSSKIEKLRTESPPDEPFGYGPPRKPRWTKDQGT